MSIDEMMKLADCPLCNRAPGVRSGPPKLVRCVNAVCEGRKLSARTVEQWTEYAALRAPEAADAGAVALAERLAGVYRVMQTASASDGRTMHVWTKDLAVVAEALEYIRSRAPTAAGIAAPPAASADAVRAWAGLDREELARIIDPGAIHNWQSLYDYNLEKEGADFARRCADHWHLPRKKAALDIADAILAALSAPVAGADAGMRERAAIYEAALTRIAKSRMNDFNTLHPEGCAPEAKAALARADALSQRPNTGGEANP